MMRMLGLWVALLVLAGPGPVCAFPSEVIHGKFDAKHSINLVIMGDGWSAADIASGKYAENCKTMVEGLFDVYPFNSTSQYYRVTRLDVPSKDSGCRYVRRRPNIDPDKRTQRETFFGVFHAELKDKVGVEFDDPNPSVPDAAFAKMDELVAGIPCDFTIILTSETISGGKALTFEGKKRGYVVVTSFNVKEGGDMGATLAHEFGHAIYGLADEYQCCETIAIPAGEPDQANVTKVSDPKLVKWSHLIRQLKGGPHQGGLTQPTGIWRPTAEGCRMRDAASEDFCDVCLERMCHRIGETVNLIESTIPGGLIVRGDPIQGMTFKVKCRGNSPTTIGAYWMLDGRNMGPGKMTEGDTGPTFEISFRIPTLSTGSHELRLLVVDKAVTFKTVDPKDVGKTPNSRVWWLDVRMRSASLLPGLDEDSAWD